MSTQIAEENSNILYQELNLASCSNTLYSKPSVYTTKKSINTLRLHGSFSNHRSILLDIFHVYRIIWFDSRTKILLLGPTFFAFWMTETYFFSTCCWIWWLIKFNWHRNGHNMIYFSWKDFFSNRLFPIVKN